MKKLCIFRRKFWPDRYFWLLRQKNWKMKEKLTGRLNLRRRRAILIAEDPDKTEKHHKSRIALLIRRKKSAMKRKHKIKCATE